MTALKVGALTLDLDKGQKFWAISGGFAEVLADNVTILAETAEPAESIDLERSEAARKRALQRLAARDEIKNFDISRTNASLARAINRIKIASGSNS
jgi:F-type H+-transporting ATPase subunit epsilon